MKLAEFFAAVGLKIDGLKDLSNLEKRLVDLTTPLRRLKDTLQPVVDKMEQLTKNALESNAGLRRFGTITGLSTQELQKWQYAAGQAGVNAEDLTSAVAGLQQARTDIMMGTGNVAPWQLLGIAPSEDPFQTLTDLRQAIRGLDPTIARSVVGQMGLGEGMFAMLRLADGEWEKLSHAFLQTDKETSNLTKLSKAMAELDFKFKAAKNRIVAELVPALIPLTEKVVKLVEKLADFAEWLSQNSAEAQRVKDILAKVAIGIAAVTTGIGILLGTATTLKSVVVIVESLAQLFALLQTRAIAAAGPIGVIVAALYDLYRLFSGQSSVFGTIGEWLDGIIAKFLKWLGVLEPIQKALSWIYGKSTGMNVGDPSADELKRLDEISRKFWEYRGRSVPDSLTHQALAPATTPTSSNQQENNVDITVYGAGGDPQRTAEAVSDSLKPHLNRLAYQQPLPA